MLDEERRAMTADEFNTLVLNEDEIAKGLAYPAQGSRRFSFIK
jgi:hypothetical protein